ncbi:MAG: trehalose-phosphatase [Gemmatimonadaceae bacterium]|nr:trehalose-phosphatase [Gemmatimonadaceae bacterium]
MRSILSRACRPVLDRVAAGRTLLAFDFDGTLAPLVDDPALAAMSPSTARLLASVSARYPCAVISGRSQSDVGARLGPAVLTWVIGNHGAEPRGTAAVAHPRMAALGAQLALALAPLGGVVLEDKGLSMSIHHRLAAEPLRVQRTVASVVAAYGDTFRIFAGHHVVNIVVAGAPTKGDAILQLRAESAADTVLFVGDDVTDEDAFRSGDDWLVGVRIGHRAGSAATYFLSSQPEIDALLAELLARRPTPLRRRELT